jgi:hypothetical protein
LGENKRLIGAGDTAFTHGDRPCLENVRDGDIWKEVMKECVTNEIHNRQ